MPATDAHLIESVINELPLLQALGRRERSALAREAQLMHARRGAWLTRRGEALPGVFTVARGSAKVALRRADGVERVLRFIAPGETFGEAAVLLGRDSAVDAVALADCTVVILPAAAIRALAARHAAFAHGMARVLAERMLGLMKEVESSELRPASERLAAYLLTLAQPAGGGGEAWTARLPATKTLVASRLGIKKETLSRLLHDLTAKRLIEVSRRDIAILDRGRLSALAGRS